VGIIVAVHAVLGKHDERHLRGTRFRHAPFNF
jgi:hypothetical protein